MKKTISIFLTLTMIISSVAVFAEDEILCTKCKEKGHTDAMCPCVDVYINGVLMETAKKARIVEGRTLVPLRSVCESLGCGVYWDNNTRVARIENSLIKVIVGIGQEYITVKDPRRNGGVPESVEIPDAVPAQFLGGYTMVPLRVISEAFGATVKWHDSERVVSIKSEYSEIVKLEKENLFAAKKDGEWIVLDSTGNEILENPPVEITELADKLISVRQVKEEKFYVIRYGLEEVIENNAKNTKLAYKKTGDYDYCVEYDKDDNSEKIIYDFGDNCVKIAKGDNRAFLDLTEFMDLSKKDDAEKEITGGESKFATAKAFSNGFAPVQINDWVCYYIDKTGAKKFPKEGNYSSANAFKDGYAAVEKDGKWGFVKVVTLADDNKEIVEIVPPQYEAVKDFSNGYAAVKKDGKWGFITIKAETDGSTKVEEIGTEDITNKSGEITKKFKYEEVKDFSNGYAAVKTDKGWGFINGYGAEAVVPQYKDVKNFANGYAGVMLDEGWRFVKKYSHIDGTTVEELVYSKYEDVGSFVNGYAAVKQNGKWGYINESGEMKIEPIYDEAKDFNGVLAEVKIDGKWTFIDFGEKVEQ